MLIVMISRAFLFAAAFIFALHLAPLRADDATVLKSDDGKIQLSVPEGWLKAHSSNSAASLEAHDEDSDAFIMVIIADRTDPYLTLDDYGKGIRDDILSHLIKSKSSNPELLEIGGFKAVRYEIHGTKPESKMAFGYFLTIIQMHHHYVQVISWAQEKDLPDNAETLKSAGKNVSFNEG
jgi:hypothetical protein